MVKNDIEEVKPVDLLEDHNFLNLVDWRCIIPNEVLYEKAETTSLEEFEEQLK